MQTTINLVSSEILLVLGSMFLALLCALPGFILDFFFKLGKIKHILFFIFAFCCAVYMTFLKEKEVLYFILGIFLNLLVIYFGLLLLKALKNMASRFGACKFCDKIKEKLRRKK